jgi:hypothetical protein
VDRLERAMGNVLVAIAPAMQALAHVEEAARIMAENNDD